MSKWKKGMSWLGLSAEDDDRYDDRYDDEYDDYDEYDDEYDDVDEVADEGVSTPRPVRGGRTVSALAAEDDQASGVTVLRPTTTRPAAVPDRPAVRPLPRSSAMAPKLVSCSQFDDAQEVGTSVKRGRPVIVDLRHMDRATARRLLDFASGVAYGLSGKVEKVGTSLYLLSPGGVEISGEDRMALKAGDLDRFET
jgi:cell division inhibitor SepF